ncbi:SWIM zinc finger family protein [Paenibacillus alkaliterrae]|uniref:SWIM zinc finger family protein n=1 Tax=Paenibacillus alkaliterrae TaxID=320909 RepID=UPI001F243E58|nr:SWIM zinc finger family protein [Paenibacillus alkaliterrae]MCF2940457.1 SWIM zinc finger family protein [Paenibacillus alkaliterrae]
MARFDYFPEYVPVAEKRRLAQNTIEKLRKKNPNISPVVITGKKIAKTWWGMSWCENLERYSDYSNRIDRGRSYVRHGAVLDLQLKQGVIEALVQGSGSKPYQVTVRIVPLSQEVWQALVAECAGKMDSLQELMEGKFPKALSSLFTAKGTGLFPAPKDISLHCSCPDSANMCKHVAAVLYGIGARLDDDTALFFRLRNVNVDELISETVSKQSKTLLEKSKKKGRRVMKDADITDVFGIDIE